MRTFRCWTPPVLRTNGSWFNATVNGGGTSIVNQGLSSYFTNGVMTNVTADHAWLIRFLQSIGASAKLGVNAAVGGTRMGVGDNNFRFIQAPLLARAVSTQLNPVLIFCGGTNDVPDSAAPALTLSERNAILNHCRGGLQLILSANPNTQIYWILMPPAIGKNQESLDRLNDDFTRMAIQEFGVNPIDLSTFVNLNGTRNWEPTYSSDELHPNTALGRDIFADAFQRQAGQGTTRPMPRLCSYTGRRTTSVYHPNLINGIFDNAFSSGMPANWAIWGTDSLTSFNQTKVLSPSPQSANRQYPGYAWRVTAGSTAAGQSLSRHTTVFNGLITPGQKLRLAGMINIAAMTNANFTVQISGSGPNAWNPLGPISYPFYQHTETTDGMVPFEYEFTVSTNVSLVSALLIWTITSTAPSANIDVSMVFTLTEAY